MTHHDVLLLPRRKQVLFGADLAFAAGTSMKCAGTELNSVTMFRAFSLSMFPVLSTFVVITMPSQSSLWLEYAR